MATCIINVEFGNVSVFIIKHIIYFKGDPDCGEETGERQMRVMGKQNEIKAIMKTINFSSCLRARLHRDFPIDSR